MVRTGPGYLGRPFIVGVGVCSTFTIIPEFPLSKECRWRFDNPIPDSVFLALRSGGRRWHIIGTGQEIENAPLRQRENLG